MVLVDISEHNRTFCDVAACRHGFRDLVLKVATHFWGAPVPESDAGIEIYDTHEPYIIFEYTVEKVKVEVHKIDVLSDQVCPGCKEYLPDALVILESIDYAFSVR